MMIFIDAQNTVKTIREKNSIIIALNVSKINAKIVYQIALIKKTFSFSYLIKKKMKLKI